VPDEMNLRQEVFSGSLAQVLRFVIGLVGTIVMAIVLGPESFGGVALVLTLGSFLDQPIGGWAVAAKQRIADQSQSPRTALGGFLLAAAAWMVVLGAGVTVAADPIRSFTGLIMGPPFVLLVIVTTSVLAGLRSLLVGRGQVGAAAWYETAMALTTTPLQIGLVVLGYGALGMLGGLVAGAAVLIPFVARRVAGWPSVPTKEEIVSQGEYARKAILQLTFGRVYDRVDLFLLGALLTPTAAGYYEVAWKLILPTSVVTGVAAGGLMTRVANRASNGESPTGDIERVLSVASVLAVPAVFGTAILGRPLIVVLFGATYAPAAPLLVGLAVYQVVSTQSAPLIQTLNGLDRIERTIPITALGLAFNVVLGVALIHPYGAIGVILATILAQALVYALLVIAVRLEVGPISPVTRPFLAQVLAGATMAAILLSIPIEFDGIRTVSLGIAVGGICYCVALLSLSSATRRAVFKIAEDLIS
jgi:O-antigen/teichoic acid export membrane protein